jgi:hypothetical protein
MAQHDRDDRDRSHGVDERIPHCFSPNAIRTSAFNVSVPGS